MASLLRENRSVATVGYEGLTLDVFLDRLREASIEAILDVRANPISRKPGFSKSALCDALEKAAIRYYAFPTLGIPTNIRRQISDRKRLLDFYERKILPEEANEIGRAAEVARRYRSALLCFEADETTCHRSRLARWVEREIKKRSKRDVYQAPFTAGELAEKLPIIANENGQQIWFVDDAGNASPVMEAINCSRTNEIGEKISPDAPTYLVLTTIPRQTLSLKEHIDFCNRMTDAIESKVA